MVLFLSTSLTEQLQAELLAGGYAADTPAAVVYKATWPEEKYLPLHGGDAPRDGDRQWSDQDLADRGGQLSGRHLSALAAVSPQLYNGVPQGGAMRAALFAFSRGGCATARRVMAALPEATLVCYTMERFEESDFLPLDKTVYGASFFLHGRTDLCGACGIAVREIAPYVKKQKN